MPVHWPPSPCVEDEATALSHEALDEPSAQSLKSDDDPAERRGAVDQYPIILDPKEKKETPRPNQSATKQPMKARGSDDNSSDDSRGPRTPTPIASRSQNRPAPGPRSKSVSFHEDPISDSTSVVSVDVKLAARGRPQVAPIETNLGADLQSMITGARRAPSPYSYTRTPFDAPAGTSSKVWSTSYRSSAEASSSPVYSRSADHQGPRSGDSDTSTISDSWPRREHSSERRRPSTKTYSKDSTTDREHQRRKEDHYSNSIGGRTHSNANRSDNPALRRPVDQTTRSLADDLTPPVSRRESRELTQDTGLAEGYRSQRPHREVQHGKESPYNSPYTSSAEESSRRRRNKIPKSEDDINTIARHSSTRHSERPDVDDLTERSRSGRSVAPRPEPEGRRSNYGSRLDPLTPVTADPKSMEDYFAKAFQDNTTAAGRFAPAARLATSNTTSPMASPIPSPLTSPPRTPVSERPGRDYFDTRPTMRSRPASVSDSHTQNGKLQTTLLSAATAGAAVAASTGVIGDATGSSPSGNTSNIGATRSRRPSPVLEGAPRIVRSASTVTDIHSPYQPHLAKAQPSSRPPSRSGAHVHDQGLPQPPRAYSYSGADASSRDAPHWVHASPEVRHSSQSHGPGLSATTPSWSQTHSAVGKPPTSHVMLPMCPRSQPSQGHRDWHTVKEMSHIDICPTCANAMIATKFRDLIVPSLPRPYNESSVCAMSKPWVRIAFVQSLRQNKANLDMLGAVSKLPHGTKACTGHKPDLRIWWDVIDPTTKEPIPNFVVCSACARMVDNVFPELNGVINRPSRALNQEKTCCMHPGSKNFLALIDHFEHGAKRYRDRTHSSKDRKWRSVDIIPLVEFIRKASRYQECPRDLLSSTRTWHFMPELPEFTICEECYEEVVWPLSDKPIAKDISKTTKIVPVRRNSIGTSGVSCQLYSEKMRRVFREAVASRKLDDLREVAKKRSTAQHRLIEMNKLCEQDQQYGIDRRADIERNNAIWRSLE